MGRKLTSILIQNICRRKFQSTARRALFHTEPELKNLSLDADSDLAALLEKKLNIEVPTQTGTGASIYRVPDRLRAVEPKAYEPNIVSIGPYHHGAYRLQAMAKTKWDFFRRIFHSTNPNRPNLKQVVDQVKQMEHEARGCYSEELKISSLNFNKIMLIDSCFIIELLKETKELDFRKKSSHIKRWMLPVLQRDLIMLENQIPLFVINKVYELIRCKQESGNLVDLALQFFESMMYKDLDNPKKMDLVVKRDGEISHFLALFRASISPSEALQNKFPVKEPNMFRSVTDLKESGVKVKKAENCQPLDVSFKKGVLKIAPVSMDDYKFTLFRNMVAYEQSHFACKPYVTAYIFFLDRLINAANDIELLHYAGVMQHTLGGNKHAATLVNNLCKEVAGAVDDSYLHNVLWKINCYCNDGWNQKMAKLKYEYFYNVWVSLSTFAAIVLIYLTILQTVAALGDDEARAHIVGNGFWMAIVEAFFVPVKGVSTTTSSSNKDSSSMSADDKFSIDGEQESMDDIGTRIDRFICWFLITSSKEHDELLMIIF
uniref:UPF0481 protein At3g47200-like n=1 Tax=Erigeron canadensis TaxID=72917 RepID=UPI001CB8CCC0|nr:UPF0481 protein At3g47200-like [Erigeron canadensis]